MKERQQHGTDQMLRDWPRKLCCIQHCLLAEMCATLPATVNRTCSRYFVIFFLTAVECSTQRYYLLLQMLLGGYKVKISREDLKKWETYCFWGHCEKLELNCLYLKGLWVYEVVLIAVQYIYMLCDIKAVKTLYSKKKNKNKNQTT